MATKGASKKGQTRATPAMNRAPAIIKREYIEHMAARSNLSDADQTLIGAYCEEHGAKMEIAREKKIWGYLISFRRCSGIDYTALDIGAILRTVGRLTALKNKKGAPITQNTRRDITQVVKQFMKWLIRRKHNTGITLEELSEVELPEIVKPKYEPDQLVSEPERDQLLAACMNLKDKAIISLLYEGGFRPVELCTLKYSDIAFSSIGCTLTVSSKEKKGSAPRPRKVPCPMSASYLKAWIDNAPYKIEGSGLVFRSLTPVITGGKREYAPMLRDSMGQQIRAIYRRAGLKYKNPYMMRHTAITRFVNTDLSPRKIMEITHGGQTRMLDTYYHGDKNQIADELTAKLHGVSSEKLQEAREAARIAKATQRACPTCGRIFDMNRKFCDECGSSLTGEPQNMKEIIRENLTLKGQMAAMQKQLDAIGKWMEKQNLPDSTGAAE